MKECCETWKRHIAWIKREEGDLWKRDMDGSLIFTDLMLYTKFCPICALPLTPDKVELPEEMPVSNSDDTLYRVLAKEINKIIKYLTQKERGL